MARIRLLVLSDLHASSPEAAAKAGPPATHLITNNPGGIVAADPMASLDKLIADENITADYVLCCGDITNAADPDGAHFAWQRLNELAKRVEAKQLFTVSGNHDMDSRQLHSKYDAKGILLTLQPGYPLEPEELANKYWARNYVIVANGFMRVVLLNTSAYHGYKDEWQHGRISELTLQALNAELTEADACRLNILICHHYPIKFGDIDREDLSQLQGAEPLLELLGSGEVGRWIIFHGHRHWPHILYSHGAATAPVVFSVGSFSAVLYPELHGRARNQVYLVEFDTDDFEHEGCDPVGTFRAWDWAKNLGWVPAEHKSGLPHIGGFGDRTSGDNAARQISDAIAASGKPFLRWNDLTTQLPFLTHLAPTDMRRCIEVLRTRHNLELLESNGIFKQVGIPQ